ncbi:hypothetical protein [Micromonospora chersina]
MSRLSAGKLRKVTSAASWVRSSTFGRAPLSSMIASTNRACRVFAWG